MTSRIDQPPITTPAAQPARHAEHTDTRQAIQRHEPEFQRKKKNEDDETTFRDAYEDLTDVSVPALRNFLSELLDRMGAHAPAAPNAEGYHEHRTPASPQAAAAMQAYQTRAGGTPPPPVPEHEAPTALDQAASNLNRNEVLELIRDLDRLSAKGVTAITLEKGDGFVASIRGGILRAMEITL